MNILRQMIALIESKTDPSMTRMEAWKAVETDLRNLNPSIRWESFKRLWTECHNRNALIYNTTSIILTL